MQKFIITRRGVFRLGDVRLHKHLLEVSDECYGGGFYEFDYASRRILLSGASYDFGAPRWSWLLREGVTLKVPKEYRGMSIVYRHDDQTMDDLCVTQEFALEYI
ncbi:MAG: hypothetical protein HUK03_02075 [Bacteroidaceae bacterium]|nr:hypothetical protein [Bacteroidaceae bacterium]